MSDKGIQERIEECVQKYGGPKKASELFQIPLGTLNSWRSGAAEPAARFIKRIAEKAEVSADWLLFGKEEGVKHRNFDLATSSIVEIPHYDVTLSAGHGTFNEAENIIDYLPFSADFIAKKLRVGDPSKLSIINVTGDSMEPTIRDGDMVMIDQGKLHFTDGIAALVYGGEAYIKRIQKDFGAIHIISDNPTYSKKTLSGPDLQQLRIIGKVVWSDKRYE